MMHLQVGLRYNFICCELDFPSIGIESVWMLKLYLFLVQLILIDHCSPEVSASIHALQYHFYMVCE